MRKNSKFYCIIIAFLFLSGTGIASTDSYPRYDGVDCSAESREDLAFNSIDEYCTHIVCEEAGICIPYYYYVYDVPVLDYRGAQIVTDSSSSTLLLRADGGAISWGNHTGMLENREDIRQQLKSGVKEIHGSDHAFAVVKNDGSVLTWTDGKNYGEIDSNSFISKIKKPLSSGVDRIFSDSAGFAALTKDDSVVSWHGGLDKKNKRTNGYKVPHLNASDVVDIQMNIGALGIWNQNGLLGESYRSWAALKKDGSVAVWGDEKSGGKIGSKRYGLQNIVKIYSTWSAFAALKKDGSVFVWGNPDGGGSLSIPWGRTKNPRFAQQALGSNVKEIYSTDSAFAAIKNDGTVITWGNSRRGGDPGDVSDLLLNIVEIVSTFDGFAALNENGMVFSWGEGLQYPFPSAPIHTDVKKLVANTSGAFAALKEDGSVVSWGNPIVGADSNAVASELESGVVDIYAAYGSFAALKEDGSVVSWGQEIDSDGTYALMHEFGHLGPKSETHPKRIKAIISSPRRDGFFAIRNDGSAVSWGVVASPYHAGFYDILDDPIWSKIFPDMNYVWYFGIEPKKRTQQ